MDGCHMTNAQETGSDASFYTTKLQRLLVEEQKKGLNGFSLLAVANRDGTPEDVARVASNIYESYLAGDCTDITNQPI